MATEFLICFVVSVSNKPNKRFRLIECFGNVPLTQSQLRIFNLL
jgi:hypothetical protein